MQNMESLQIVKEQLKLKTIELRKASEERNKATKKMKDLMVFNQGEVKKLKEVIKQKDAAIAEKEDEVVAARMATIAAKSSKEKKGAEEGEEVKEIITKDPDEELLKKIDELRTRARVLKEKVDDEKKSNKKFQRERDILLKELKRLRKDSESVDNLKERIEALKAEVSKAKKTSMGTGVVTEGLVREKDELIKKYENMLYGDMDASEDGMLPSEIIQELKEEVEDLEKERKTMLVELEMLKEDNAEMEMKLTLLEEKKDVGEKGGGEYRTNVESRAAVSSEFSAGLENFLITYSDMITLLLVIFVLMYTVSKLDENRFAEALSSFQEKKMRIESVNVRLSKDEMKMLERVRELVKDNVDPENLVRGDTRTILHRLPTSDLFGPGSAVLVEGAGQLILEDIQEDMKEGVKQVLVDGHTDNVPMSSEQFPSNWELSAARASSVARFIIEEMRFPPSRMVVTGYGEFRPLKPNTNDENRSLNRRVEIKILKDIKVAEEEQQERQEQQQTGQPAGTSPGAPGQSLPPAGSASPVTPSGQPGSSG